MADSFNELFGLGSHSPDASLAVYFPMQDDAASTAIANVNGSEGDGILTGSNTSDLSTTGPNSYLTKALGFNGITNRVDKSVTTHNDDCAVGVWVAGADVNEGLVGLYNSGSSSDQLRVHTFGPSQFANVQTASSVANPNVAGSTDVVNSSWWLVGGNFSYRDAREVFVSGSSEGSEGTNTSESNLNRFTVGVTGDSTPAGFSGGAFAGGFLFFRTLTSDEWSQIYNGPEPVSTVAPTLTIDGSSWSGTVGTWTLDTPFVSGSNGTTTYSWELRDADDDSVVESGSGSSPSGSGSYSGDYYLWVRATNNGGYDPAEDSVSATQSAGSPSTPVVPIIRHHLIMQGAA